MRFRLAAAVLLWTIAGHSQQPAQEAPQQQPEQQQQAEQQPAEQQPEPEYGGPAILSRGGGPTIGTGSELARLRPFISVKGIYDTGLAGVPGGGQDQSPLTEAYGVETSFGIQGHHPWRRGDLGLDYRGAYRRYSRKTSYEGMDNSLTLTLQHRLSRRVTVLLGENAARYSRSFFLPNGTNRAYDPLLAGMTANDLYDTPTNVFLSSAQMIYQRTARLSFGIGGTGFLVRRQSSALVGAYGYVANGNLAYRLSRFQTIGVGYTFTHFGFQRQFGSSDIHGATLDYSIRLGRSWEIRLAAGGYRVESLFLRTVELDPAIAVILGQRTGIERFHGVGYVPNYQGHITRAFRRASAGLSYTRGVMPGNGVYLTSGYESADISYTYRGFRRLGLFASAGYNSYTSLMQALGKYRSFTSSGGLSYKLNKVMSLEARVDGRRYYAAGTNLNRIYYRATLGLAWAPGDYPLSIW